MKSELSTLIVTLNLALSLGACSSPPPVREAGPLKRDTSVEITYLLGHKQQRMVVASSGTLVSAQSFSDRNVLEHTVVDLRKYETFFRRTLAFIDMTQDGRRAPSGYPICRSPYTIVVTNGPDRWVDTGCRSHDDGAFGKLVREGEFLLYSKN